MIAADTNVVVRLLMADDADQYARARSLFAAEQIFIPKTVLLETEWVLRGAHRLRRPAILEALESLIDLPNVHCEDEPAIREALGLARSGMDVADALHVASSHSAGRFATFDSRLLKAARTYALPVFSL